MDGIINIYKETGFTSHDVVAKLRGILHQKKIGHTGTLDPAAAGVLPVCCGKATKACGLLTDRDKSYHAVCRLGIETDTQDMTGSITRKCSIKGITEKDILDCTSQFQGGIMQVPPMYSALKTGGKRLYELAREGKTVERKPRPVTILSIKVTDINLKEGIFSMDITCSKGTYIRTLCHDIGIALGNAAAMEKLVRTRVSVFSIDDAITLSEVKKAADAGYSVLEKYFMPVDALFPEYKKSRIKEEYASFLSNGNRLGENMLYYESPRLDAARNDDGVLCNGEKVLVYDENGKFKAIYERDGNAYKCGKMF